MAVYFSPKGGQTRSEYAKSLGLEILALEVQKKTYHRWTLAGALKTMWDGDAGYSLQRFLFDAWRENEPCLYLKTNVRTRLKLRGLFCQFIGNSTSNAYPTVLFAHDNDHVREAGLESLLQALNIYRHPDFYGDFGILALPRIRNLGGPGFEHDTDGDAGSQAISARERFRNAIRTVIKIMHTAQLTGSEFYSDLLLPTPSSLTWSMKIHFDSAKDGRGQYGDILNACGQEITISASESLQIFVATLGGVLCDGEGTFYGLTSAHMLPHRDREVTYNFGSAVTSESTLETVVWQSENPAIDWALIRQGISRLPSAYDRRYRGPSFHDSDGSDYDMDSPSAPEPDIDLHSDPVLRSQPNANLMGRLYNKQPAISSNVHSHSFHSPSSGAMSSIMSFEQPQEGKIFLSTRRGVLEGICLGEVMSEDPDDRFCWALQLVKDVLAIGDSGSWVLNESGAVCGMLLRGFEDIGIGYFVPFETLLEDIAQTIPFNSDGLHLPTLKDIWVEAIRRKNTEAVEAIYNTNWPSLSDQTDKKLMDQLLETAISYDFWPAVLGLLRSSATFSTMPPSFWIDIIQRMSTSTATWELVDYILSNSPNDDLIKELSQNKHVIEGAVKYDRSETARKLLDRGAFDLLPASCIKDLTETPEKPQRVEMLNLLLASRVKSSQAQSSNSTWAHEALYEAARGGRNGYIEAILNHDATLIDQRAQGRTVLRSVLDSGTCPASTILLLVKRNRASEDGLFTFAMKTWSVPGSADINMEDLLKEQNDPTSTRGIQLMEYLLNEDNDLRASMYDFSEMLTYTAAGHALQIEAAKMVARRITDDEFRRWSAPDSELHVLRRADRVNDKALFQLIRDRFMAVGAAGNVR